MKGMKNFVVGMLFALCVAGAYKYGHADTAPLAFGVTADSNNGFSTVVYRNGSGSVDSLNMVTATMSGAFFPTVRTKAQFSAATGVVGATYLCSDCTIAYSVCVGTGTTLSGWKVSHSATVGCGTNN